MNSNGSNPFSKSTATGPTDAKSLSINTFSNLFKINNLVSQQIVIPILPQNATNLGNNHAIKYNIGSHYDLTVHFCLSPVVHIKPRTILTVYYRVLQDS